MEFHLPIEARRQVVPYMLPEQQVEDEMTLLNGEGDQMHVAGVAGVPDIDENVPQQPEDDDLAVPSMGN
ncbi:hypothetical protein THASP1DRAFT_28558 [Thamnocephalis sphaerospora]|uniref:Uncharacterized protein n=1 Tax=Thamnocephalis sphaerospora TaxID=78915 RepID=A0A4P9XTW7_9FUNG|nr:hypothetical protein THASP1DRAFT_28558 [Thamnocephalis sphaerospora]|eukprot:RKP09644.1 hypothetical protein THASP1DRAFT_28558 [Thamnocephalis sphaerospora]